MKISKLRLTIQVSSFLLLVYGGFCAVSLGNYLPTFACPFVGSRGGGCFLMPLQRMLELPFGNYPGYWGFKFGVAFLTFFFLFILFNKSWCGWVCPLGFVQDLLTMLRKSLNIRGASFSWNLRDRLKIVKYGFLGLLVLIPIGIGNSFCGGRCQIHPDLHYPFCQICPAKPLMPMFSGNFSHIGINFSNSVTVIMTSLSMIILGIFLVGSFFKERFFCSYCPMSALMSLFDRFGFMGLRKKASKCTSCGICARVCPMEIREVYLEEERYNVLTQDCMLCMKCVEHCPEDGALKVTYARKSIFTSSRMGVFNRQGHE
ncbi:MAG: 4Fe-4S binding protein [Planctomycetota bacterium]|jgi:polyferredoxin